MNSVLVITIIGILLIVASVFLIGAVLMQSAKNSRMSGVVSGGGAETFFGKYKGKTIDKKLNRLTVIIAIAFAAIVILLYIVQPGTGKVDYGDDPDWDQAQAALTATTTAAPTKAPSTSGSAPATSGDDAPATTTAATGTQAPETTE